MHKDPHNSSFWAKEVEQGSFLGWRYVGKIFTSLKTVCRETKLKEFQYKLIHRIVVTKKDLYRYGIKEDDECVYCGEKDPIDHTFRDCHFVKIFIQQVINWLNIESKIKLNPSSEERLFGIISDLHEKVLVKKCNYTMLFMRYYIYTNNHTTNQFPSRTSLIKW